MSRICRGGGLCGLVIMLCGCTVSKPEIVELYWQIRHRRNVETNETFEQFSFFAHVSDPDGNEDIESIYLVSDSSQMYWRIQSDAWEQKLFDNELWIGSGSIRMYRGESFPRGGYRVIVTDRAGEQAESSLYVSSDRVSPESTEYPGLTLSGDEIRIAGPYQRHTLWFYDGAGEIVKLLSTTSRVVPISSVLSSSERDRTVSVSLYAYNDTSGIGTISGEYPVRKP